MRDQSRGNEPGEATEIVDCTIMRGPDGGLYCFTDETMKAHRLPDEVAEALAAAYGDPESEVSGFGTPVFGHSEPRPSGLDPFQPSVGSFDIVAKGPIVRRKGLGVPTQDGWFDQYA